MRQDTDPATALQAHCAKDHGADGLHLPGWTVDDWRALLAAAEPRELPAGGVLMRAGDVERALYFVLAGALDVSEQPPGAGSAVGGTRTPAAPFRERAGSVVGEIAFFDGRPRTAHVWAPFPTRLLRLDADAALAFANQHPRLGSELLLAIGRVLAFRMRRAARREALGADAPPPGRPLP